MGTHPIFESDFDCLTENMSYQVYRNTTLGTTLQDSLDELLQSHQITETIKNKVLEEYDRAINNALATRVRNRINFKGELDTYRFCDNVWTFVINNAEFREVIETIKVDKVKVVACDAKGSTARIGLRIDKRDFFFCETFFLLRFIVLMKNCLFQVQI